MYSLVFREKALKQWNSLDSGIRRELMPILRRRLLNPFVPSARLRNELSDCYKIKLRKAGIRLVYYPDGNNLIVYVLAVGKREGEAAYRDALLELED